MKRRISLIFLSVIFLHYLSAFAQDTINAEVIYSIGGDTNDPNEMLILPNSIGVDKKGNLFILDSKESIVKKYDKTGKLLKKFGKKGRGPGEFIMSSDLGIDPSGNIYVYDGMSFHFCVFDNNGKFLKNIKFNTMIWKMRFAKNGIYIETQQIRREGKIGTNFVQVDFYNYSLKKRKTIFKYDIQQWIYEKFGNRKLAMQLPFRDNVYWDITCESNVIVAYTDGYRVEIYSSNGKIENIFTHSSTKQKVSERDKENIISQRLNEVSNSEMKRFAKANLQFPDYKPFFRMIHIDDQDNILLTTYDEIENNYLVDVFNLEGEFVNQTKISKDIFTKGSIFKDGNLYSNYSGGDMYGEVRKYRIIQ